MEYVTIPSMALRVSGVLALTLGIIFWTGNYQELQPLHMGLGIVVVLSLWWLALLFARAGRGAGPSVIAFIVGLVVVAVGITQDKILPTEQHWIIKVTHLLLGVLAIGLGEMLGARLQRKALAS